MMIPHLLVKCKEVTMDIQSSLIELEETAQKISDGLAAIHIMILGMDEGQYAGAFHAVWSYLSEIGRASCRERVSWFV